MQYTEEIWKCVPGYVGLYRVSNKGRVKSIRFKRTQRILKARLGGNGYYGVNLGNRYFEIHKIVAMAFLNHKPDGLKMVVHHKDHNQLNNRVDNLQIVTNRENTSKKKGKEEGKYSSIYTGVHRRKKGNEYVGKWQAEIRIKGGKVKRLGNYLTEIEASEAYQKELAIING